jgi:hypothetical protein
VQAAKLAVDARRKGTDMAKQGQHRIGPDAKTGEYILVKVAERRPGTTVVETIKPAPKRK